MSNCCEIDPRTHVVLASVKEVQEEELRTSIFCFPSACDGLIVMTKQKTILEVVAPSLRALRDHISSLSQLVLGSNDHILILGGSFGRIVGLRLEIKDHATRL